MELAVTSVSMLTLLIVLNLLQAVALAFGGYILKDLRARIARMEDRCFNLHLAYRKEVGA